MAYRIRTLGSRIVVGTEDEAILICKTLAVAQQAVADAEQAPTIPTLQLLAQHAARTGAVTPPEEGIVATDVADEPFLDRLRVANE